MQHLSMRELKENLVSKGFQLTPYSEEEINEAIAYFGQLPETLVAYYQLIGRIDFTDVDDGYIEIISPAELISRSSEENLFINIADEYCYSFELAIKKENLNEESPEVYLGGEVAYGMTEGNEQALTDAGILFASEDFRYISGHLKGLSDVLCMYGVSEGEDINYLEDLLTAINYFFQYQEAV
ncbi:hypothetical protein [Isobaculum melis]|uniref:SMI1 / KNR4 family (SUKH-1) n=1 Tax=Isobaculum melis TaxID=142588 RepID=A0A1H9PT30_9LACT|nr:hypothetical protein [Isobaculum melis]SER50995.1 hypothetical protein SAMN04488559_101101 [Isobaculum melis]